MDLFKGIAVSKGIAIGPIRLYNPSDVPLGQLFLESSIEEQISFYETVRVKSLEELDMLQAGLEKEQGAIFDAHGEILNDPVIADEILLRVRSGTSKLDEAIYMVYSAYIDILKNNADPVFQERAKDMADVRDRLLRLCTGSSNSLPLEIQTPCILVAKDLLPSDTALLDPAKVLAIVTEQGGATSHTAIIARSYGIPALLGVGNILPQMKDGEMAVVDACKGVLLLNVNDKSLNEYRQKVREYADQTEKMARYLSIPAVTQDGIHIDITLNIASVNSKVLSLAPNIDGIGLFRTEFLFLGRQNLPDEEEQTKIYRDVLSAFERKPVILRTLDIGGDKQTECIKLPHEENPFLGNRALRLCFSRPDIFSTQLRAALRASTAGTLWLMLPMVGSLDDIRRAKEILHAVQADLDYKGIPYSKEIKLGIMVEIPSIALLAEEVAKEVDFASIGSNDLCQYLMAADRMNPEVAPYCQSMNPAMFRLIRSVVHAFSAHGKSISLCGELGGNPQAAAVLVGLGIRKLSMNIDSLPEVKKMICDISLMQADKIAQHVCELCTEHEVTQYLKSVFPNT